MAAILKAKKEPTAIIEYKKIPSKLMIALPHYQGFHVGAFGTGFHLLNNPLNTLATSTPNANLPLWERGIL